MRRRKKRVNIDKALEGITILHASKTSLVATNAKERAVWKKVSDNSYVFSHMEKLHD